MSDLPESELVVRAGAPFARTFPVLQGDGSPVPFVAVASARAQVRENYKGALLHSWTTIVLDSGGDATVQISATATETAGFVEDWPSKRVFWDLEVTDADGNAHVLTEVSKVQLKPRITQ